MYNESAKRSFINHKDENVIIPPNVLENLFKKTEYFEEKYQKDVSCFTKMEAHTLMKYLGGFKVEHVKIHHSYLSQYTNWCLKKGLVPDGQNHFDEIKPGTFKDYVNKRVANSRIVTREEILDWTTKVRNPRDAFIILALFEYGNAANAYKDIWNVKLSDIDGNIIHLNGREAYISDQLIKIATASAMAVEYVNDYREKYLIDDGTIIKLVPPSRLNASEHQRGKNVYMALQRLIVDISPSKVLTGQGLIDSGIIDMIKRESAKYGITTEKYVFSDHMHEVEKQYGRKINARKVFWDTFKDYL